MPQAGATSGNPPPAATSLPQASANPAANDGRPIANGLWEDGATDADGSLCGWGNCPPADWYAYLGAMVVSRSKTRPLDISFRSPVTGNFAAVQTDLPAAGDFNVLNAPGSTLSTSGVMDRKSVGLGIAPGYELTVGHYFCRDSNNNDHFLEFTFWSLNSWADSEPSMASSYPNTTSRLSIPLRRRRPSMRVCWFRRRRDYSTGSLRTPFPEPAELRTNDQKTISFAFNNGVEQAVSYKSTMNNSNSTAGSIRGASPISWSCIPTASGARNANWARTSPTCMACGL